MSHYGGWITVLGGLFALIIVVASSLAIARASFAKSQIEFLRGANEDLQKRVTYLEGENTRREAELITEKDKVGVLESVVTGREQLEEIKNMITQHDNEADRRQTAMYTSIEQVIVKLDQNNQLLTGIRKVVNS